MNPTCFKELTTTYCSKLISHNVPLCIARMFVKLYKIKPSAEFTLHATSLQCTGLLLNKGQFVIHI